MRHDPQVPDIHRVKLHSHTVHRSTCPIPHDGRHYPSPPLFAQHPLWRHTRLVSQEADKLVGHLRRSTDVAHSILAVILGSVHTLLEAINRAGEVRFCDPSAERAVGKLAMLDSSIVTSPRQVQ